MFTGVVVIYDVTYDVTVTTACRPVLYAQPDSGFLTLVMVTGIEWVMVVIGRPKNSKYLLYLGRPTGRPTTVPTTIIWTIISIC